MFSLTHISASSETGTLVSSLLADQEVDLPGFFVAENLLEREVHRLRQTRGVVRGQDVGVRAADVSQRAQLSCAVENVDPVGAQQREAALRQGVVPDLLQRGCRFRQPSLAEDVHHLAEDARPPVRGALCNCVEQPADDLLEGFC